MGLFKKLFRRKKSSAVEGDVVASNAGNSEQKSKQNSDGPDRAVTHHHSPSQQKYLRNGEAGPHSRAPARVDDSSVDINRASSFTPMSAASRNSNANLERDMDAMVGRSPRQSKSEHVRVLSPRNQSGGQHSYVTSNDSKYHMTTVRHDENLNHSSSAGSSISTHLSHQQLQKFDLQNVGRIPSSGTMGPGHSMYTMSTEVPKGQLQAMDDMNRSDASSSSFNLSTDAEDSEYETLRRLGVIPRSSRSRGDNSVMSAISGPTYNTEDERLFPALHTDDDLTSATSQSGQEASSALQLQRLGMNIKPYTTPLRDDEPSRMQVYVQPPTRQKQAPGFAMNSETDDDMRAWGVSPSTTSNKDPASAKSGGSPNQVFTFENSSSPRSPKDDAFTPRSNVPIDPPASTTSRSTVARNFTSPASRASSNNSGFSPDPDFATFVDFNSFGSNAFATRKGESKESAISWREEKKTQDVIPSRHTTPRELKGLEKGSDIQDGVPRDTMPSTTSQYAHSSPGGPDTSLSELLAQAKNKQRRGNRNHRSSRASSSSVNSAPAITASFLRQHHNLGRYSTGTSGGNTYSGNDRSSNDGASVSDIIQSLEATNQSRMKNGSRVSYGHRSVGDIGAVSTARAVKERLREKRRQERELGTNLQNPPHSEESSTDNSDNEASESWLFDEVTGALGPRGIAADLESLSGRSNRSKNSQGNKSHKSHKSRSRRSRQSGTTRRHKSSGDSVESRTSRNSRYSHRSTKSFLSQMSEQSRSVANDLLRLEMQLAMVGSGDNRDDIPSRVGGGSVSGTSVGASSRVSRNGGRKSLNSQYRSSPTNSQVPSISAATRRNKINVLAPPGKLGIILANKADSKGTVVSGVRTSSVLADKISPGDRIVAIDGEDVSRMTVSEITTIMSRKADYDRTLTVLTIPKQIEQYGQSATNVGSQNNPNSHTGAASPSKGKAALDSFENGFSQFRR